MSSLGFVLRCSCVMFIRIYGTFKNLVRLMILPNCEPCIISDAYSCEATSVFCIYPICFLDILVVRRPCPGRFSIDGSVQAKPSCHKTFMGMLMLPWCAREGHADCERKFREGPFRNVFLFKWNNPVRQFGKMAGMSRSWRRILGLTQNLARVAWRDHRTSGGRYDVTWHYGWSPRSGAGVVAYHTRATA